VARSPVKEGRTASLEQAHRAPYGPGFISFQKGTHYDFVVPHARAERAGSHFLALLEDASVREPLVTASGRPNGIEVDHQLGLGRLPDGRLATSASEL